MEYGNSYSDWKQWKESTALKNYMLALVPGNKENYKRTSSGRVKNYSNQWYLDNTNNPSNGASGVKTSYWFIYNNVLFINLDTNVSCSSTVRNWFKSVVSAQEGNYQYIVVQKHYPYFKTDSGDVIVCDYGDYTKWYEIFDECGVDFALSADHHVYTRSERLYNNAVSTSSKKGTVYLTYPMITASSRNDATKLSTAKGTNPLIAAFATGGSTGAGVFDVTSSKMVRRSTKAKPLIFRILYTLPCSVIFLPIYFIIFSASTFESSIIPFINFIFFSEKIIIFPP